MSEVTARPVGRPSNYPSTDDGVAELIDRVLAYASEGRSITQISARIDVPKTTLLRWADNHEEFRTTLTRAKELEQSFWEDQALDNLKNKDFNANLWNKSMGSRFKSEYGDRTEVVGAGGKDFMPESTETRDIARAVLSVLANAKIEKKGETE